MKSLSGKKNLKQPGTKNPVQSLSTNRRTFWKLGRTILPKNIQPALKAVLLLELRNTC